MLCSHAFTLCFLLPRRAATRSAPLKSPHTTKTQDPRASPLPGHPIPAPPCP
ncbi:hypothetical protein B0H10DRAFT_2055510, partial [Mycena sp. CBHHK59/15]